MTAINRYVGILSVVITGVGVGDGVSAEVRISVGEGSGVIVGVIRGRVYREEKDDRSVDTSRAVLMNIQSEL